MVKEIVIFKGELPSIGDQNTERLLELPEIKDGFVISQGVNPPVRATYFARILINDFSNNSWDWLGRDIDFWIDVFRQDFDLIRTVGWPALGTPLPRPRTNNSNTFFTCEQEQVLDAIRQDTVSAIFGCDFVARKGVHENHPKMYGMSIVFHFSYPYFLGDKSWVDEQLDRVIEYYIGKEYEIVTFENEMEIRSVLKKHLFPRTPFDTFDTTDS